ncbi:glycoside hydrolase family 3 N-terminal domain-containing protein [Novosphingobium piscinae]|uniref:Glycoside hydrolase family 3 C-terminal domain-containing protein n=1 Tax=Novosphingobium piscinae TaxID=1507448 RepID=A0A7X1G010_9SPHN|nr:glycoside hydrolase family 3 protein [Novosphingobium piscinae]MBC2670120.1 glycoside hydrolase family 3 C-terminal domain-containing protein [Novosphingobium piscinae]
MSRLVAGLAMLAASSGAIAQVAAPPVAAVPDSAIAHPQLWPQGRSQGLVNPATEARITALLAQMSLAEKIGQMIQADISAIQPDDLRRYPLGSILAGGSSPPLGAPDRSPAGPWIATARAFDAVARESRPGHVAIPLLIGIDAVHGNNNIVGATLFPHNIGLGATRDPGLIERIGRATAVETAAAGINWAFGPTLAVPQNDRWGRTFEGYSEDPAVVASYAGAMVKGLQGAPGKGTIQQGQVAASVKHFLGDGGTTDGIDQGDTAVDEGTLIRVHNAGYPAAIAAGTMTVMASFNSWNGVKMHGNRSLLTDVLKQRMGFQGLVVGDWNGHAQIPGCTATDCPATFNAGLDMAMAPDSWRGLFDSTLAAAQRGQIPLARIDDAVRRILRIKFGLGLFDPNRPMEADTRLIGAPEHRAIAREAVRKSMVLLKNQGVLPIRPSARVLVTGAGADSIAQQSGGWTLSWQGDGNSNADFPGATSIYQGIKAALTAGGGAAELSTDGSFASRPDVAIVVFGEKPYAEMRGDIRTLEFEAGEKEALALLQRLKRQGIPTVSVFLSGRPLWVNPELNQSDAFVAAWLPGSEGAGIADVLIGGKTDFVGTLPYSWPKTAGQFRLNAGQPGYDPLFPLGYGLSYARPGHVAALPEVAGLDASLANTSIFFARGKSPAPFRLLFDPSVAAYAVDSATTQEGANRLEWSGAGQVRIAGPVANFERESNADLNLQVVLRLDQTAGPVQLRFAGGAIDLAGMLGTGAAWQTLRIPLKCFVARGARLDSVTEPVAIAGTKGLKLTIADLRLNADPAGARCP